MVCPVCCVVSLDGKKAAVINALPGSALSLTK
jgi:hypothetical protein